MGVTSECDKDGQPRTESNSSESQRACGRESNFAHMYISVRSDPHEATVGQQPSIWSTYVQLADKHDENMFGRWNSSMNTLLVFVRVMVPALVLL